ncbi:phage tail tape measure protein [uncultured Bacteroides sp.]|uniref:phage tail tape measure protein n=1 Tax=uncultured Bacteroides sp. TaxID=162156 RepID=UPI002AAB4746|nr:phage tail tape measure protein [uncultured Bacteroides sp.]
MSLKIDRVQLEIVIQQDAARQKMIQLEDKMRDTRKELKKLKEGTEEYAAKSAELKGLQKEYDSLFEKIGIGSLSLKELGNRQKELNAIIKNLPGDSSEYKQYSNQLNEVNTRIKELRGNATEAKFSIGKLADGFNKYAAMGAGLIASLTGVALTARKCVDEFAAMEEAESQTRKYTGLTTKEVKELNEEFKKMDTRTSREQLNEISGEAGKIGVTGKKNILEFVDAANMIKVSLGEDLGKDAVLNIGKLAQMFGEDKKMGLRGAMLATGSAINAVAQNSSAAEEYLVGFTARVAGAANQAKVSQTSLLGYASVLDQNMQQQEMAGTAFQTLMLKMYQNPAKFAKMAGESVSEFTNLIKTDANEAILRFLEVLNNKGGLDKLAPMFKDMGLEGVRASGVISTMAGKVDDIRAAQDLANKSYKEGTSIIQEYNIQNNTVQGEIDKRKKQFQEIRIELGEKLLPAMKYMISGGSMTIKMLSSMVTFFIKYGSTIASLVIILGAYTAAVKLSTLWQSKFNAVSVETIVVEKAKAYWSKIVTAATLLQVAATGYLTGATRAANLAMKEFFVMLGLNPIGIAVAGVVALTTAMYFLSQKTDIATQAREHLNNVYQKAIEKTDEEKNRVKSLLSIIHSETVAYTEKQKAINDLKTIIPQYNAVLSKTGKVTNENTEAINNYISALLRKNKLEGLKDNLEELYGDKFEKERKVKKDREDYNSKKKLQNSGSMAPVVGMSATDVSDYYLKQDEEDLDVINEKLKTVKKAYQAAFIPEKKNSSTVKKNTKNTNSGGSSTSGTGKDKQPWNAEIQSAENSYKEQLLLLKKSSDKRGQTESEYQMDALQKETDFQLKKLSIINKYQGKVTDKKKKAELGKLESETNAAIYDSLKKSEDNRLTILKEYRDKRLEKVKSGEEGIKLELSKQYEKGELKEKDYKNRIAALEVATSSERLAILKDYQDDVSGLEFKNGEKKATVVKEAGDAVLLSEKEVNEKRAEIAKSSSDLVEKFGEEYRKLNYKASMDETLNALDIFYQSQLELAEKNGIDTTNLTKIYEEAKKNITEDYAKDRKEVIKKYGLESAEENKNLKLKALEEEHAQGLLSEKEYEVAKNKIFNDYLKEKIQANKVYFDAFNEVLSNVSSAVQGFQDAEVSKTESAYDKKIKAAKKAGKDTTKLEEEKEESVAAVKKKYAEMQFAINVLQTISSTALSAMLAYSSLAWIPGVGPALGAAAAAAAIAAGAAQIAVAKQQRDEAKGLKAGGYSDDYIEGYTKSGNPDDVAGAIPVHKSEFVANHNAVANPHVRQFLDIFDVAQKNGSIRMINTTQILEQIRTKTGKYSGGYTSSDDSNSGTGISINNTGNNNSSLERVIKLMSESVELLKVISVKDLKVNAKDVRDEIKRIEKLEQNVNR